LLAIAEVESGGRAYALVNKKREPLIRFEGHYFDRRLTGIKREQARAAGLADPRAGAVRNPSSQAERWQMLHRAAAIDGAAAHESVSWGLGQVMGAHWRWLGFSSVDAMAAECRGSVAGQIRVMLLYCDKAGLLPAIRNKDWAAFARGYNGPAYAANRYHEKLAVAFVKHHARLKPTPLPDPVSPVSSQKPASKRPTLLAILSRWLSKPAKLSSLLSVAGFCQSV
jgi:hypothetical protein